MAEGGKVVVDINIGKITVDFQTILPTFSVRELLDHLKRQIEETKKLVAWAEEDPPSDDQRLILEHWVDHLANLEKEHDTLLARCGV